MKKITVKINGKDILAESGKSILEVAKENGIKIPFLCFHPDVETTQHCNMCIVQIAGENELMRACTTKVKEGMEITTDSEEIEEKRKANLDKILKKHLLKCSECVLLQNCKLLELVKDFKGKPTMEKSDEDKILEVGEIIFDQTKCIGCGNCTVVCPTNFLSLNERNRVAPSSDEKKDCVNCGQCILHCPVGAIKSAGEFDELLNLETYMADENKTIVVQFAPSIRTSIGEEFGMEPGEIVTEKLIAGLKKLGFAYVFDTAAGADFTTMEESDELIERVLKNENLPAFSSCCPSWVSFLEFNYPEFIPNLCTSRSPQTMLGGIIKNYWSKIKNIDPKNIFVVSIMPCVAKKHEVKREEMKIDGIYPVDMVLTTRELARMFKKKGINLKDIEGVKADDPLCVPSGAGVIYGASGGVFESAFRTAYHKVTGLELPNEAIKEIRGTVEGIKVKELHLGEKRVKVCVVSGIKNAKKILDELKENPGLYDAVEVMACPGGCVGGGGQSLPITMDIVKKRAASLYKIDDDGAIKGAHDNPVIKTIYADFFNNKETRHKILHTHFSPKKKAKINVINK
ncbi:ferredoxin [bacterium]|nr:ferredoxin [bacterium]